MSRASEGAEKNHSNSQQLMREDSEYVRLVLSDEPNIEEVDRLHSRTPEKYKSLTWWIKVLLGFTVSIVLLYISVKWGVPFVLEKVFLIAAVASCCNVVLAYFGM